MAKTKKTDPRDLTEVWNAPMTCRGYRLSREEILRRMEHAADERRQVRLWMIRGRVMQFRAPRALLAEIMPDMKKASTDAEAQELLRKVGVDYHSGCGTDLRDQMYDVLVEEGRGKRVGFTCAACGQAHTYKAPTIAQDALALAQERDVDHLDLTGSGFQGLITVKDVEEA